MIFPVSCKNFHELFTVGQTVFYLGALGLTKKRVKEVTKSTIVLDMGDKDLRLKQGEIEEEVFRTKVEFLEYQKKYLADSITRHLDKVTKLQMKIIRIENELKQLWYEEEFGETEEEK